MFFGMVNGIELTSSSQAQAQVQAQAHPGRIVIPGWAILNKTGVTGKYDVSGSALMFSDDHGQTWQVGEVLTKGGRIENTQPSESTVVKLKNGSLLVNIRDSLNVEDERDKTRCGCRLIGRSDDGGATWAALWQEPDLWSSGVEGSMITTSTCTSGTSLPSSIVWFSNPRSKTGRVNGTVYYSVNDGSPVSTIIHLHRNLIPRGVYREMLSLCLQGSWVEAGRVPGEVWKAGPGRPLDTFNFGYNMMVSLPTATSPSNQAFGVLYQNGWVGNAGTHYAFECNDPCCGPSVVHPETSLCGVLFARFELPLPK